MKRSCAVCLDSLVRGSRFASLASTAALMAFASGSAVAQAPAKAGPVFADGQAQVVPAFENRSDWVRDELWVETEFDSDGDGVRDRVHVDVTRPAQTQTEGLKVPVVYETSPYFSGVDGGTQFWSVEQEVDAASPPRKAGSDIPFGGGGSAISESEVETWVPRGFAVVHSESPGTGRSYGCPSSGGTNESLAPKAVIDWLNGRARGFTSATGNDEVRATWSTGKVGMIGTSYNGALTIAAASTGVDGLAAIIPISPVSSWYQYYRSYGLVRNPGGYPGEDMDVLYDFVNSGDPARRGYCDRVVRDGELVSHADRATGDYNDFWAGRDYLTNVDKMKAAMLVAHGLNDWNTMPEQSIRIYEALAQRKVPAQLYLHQGEHGGPPPLEQMNRWFTRYLYDVANDVERAPRAWIVRENNSSEPQSYANYPNPAAAPVALHPDTGGVGIGGLRPAGPVVQAHETLTDDASVSSSQLAESRQSNSRLLYATRALVDAVHLSGWTEVTIRLASNKPAANLSVWLVALPEAGGGATLITRGWADPQNHASLSHGEPLQPGQFYTMTFKLQPDDQIVPAGQRLGLMIFSSDQEFTVHPKPGTQLTVDLGATSITLPVVGGSKALLHALGQ